jgi:hypothetical protein
MEKVEKGEQYNEKGIPGWLVCASVSFAGVSSFDDNLKFAEGDFSEVWKTGFDDASWHTVNAPPPEKK